MLGSDGSESSDGPADPLGAGPETGLAARLPPGTRGVVVDVTRGRFDPGDVVDVHAASTGALVVTEVEVTGADQGGAVIAVHPDQVEPVIEAVTTGGVILVLVPALVPERAPRPPAS